MVSTVMGSRGKMRRSEKVREFDIPKSGENKRVGKVGENQSTRVQKLTKMQKQNLNCLCTMVKNFSDHFFHRLFVPPFLNLFRCPCF